MEELEIQERPGIFTRLAGVFTKDRDFEDEFEASDSAAPRLQLRKSGCYQITVRRQIMSFQDAVAAADGLKKGEQQILNLTSCEFSLKEKIKDFMCGVNYAEEGTWEELGEDIFLLAPTNAMVEVAPATPRMNATRN